MQKVYAVMPRLRSVGVIRVREVKDGCVTSACSLVELPPVSCTWRAAPALELGQMWRLFLVHFASALFAET